MNRGRLLILDDDSAVARTIAAIAQVERFEVRLSSEPEAFFEQVAIWSPTHLAVDLVMPGMDGIEVLRTLAARRCSARIIVTSGMGAKVLESARNAAAERGLQIAGILPKPFKADALRELLRSAHVGVLSTHENVAVPRKRVLNEQDLRMALDSSEVLAYFQPKVELTEGTVHGFEALARWQHPVFGLLQPEEFIPLAEKSGVIDALTYRLFAMALSWLSQLPNALDQSIALNLSVQNLDDLRLADRLAEECTRYQVAPDRVILEVTESGAMRNPIDAMDTLTRLRIKGFRVSLDDFGTGYSSMVQLARLPFSEMKVDKSFVSSMTQSPESRKIVESIIQLGTSLGLQTVAEGLEDARTMEMLRDAGCRLAQGFYFARPMDPAAAKRWYAQRVLSRKRAATHSADQT
jgi:EAL domain-containing protein (putative c-di-GMP-specific phosphodiesterase class I)